MISLSRIHMIKILAILFAIIITFRFFKNMYLKHKYRNLPRLVGVTGKKYHGKDTVADYIANKYKYNKYALAHIIKLICSIMFGLNDEQLNGSKKEIPIPGWYNLTPRTMFQFVGTELFRDNMHKLHKDIGNDIWIISAEKKIERDNAKQIRTIIPDVRFENEIDMIRKHRGVVIKVVRNVENTDSHSSEMFDSDDLVDIIIDNNGTKHDLYKKIDKFMDRFI